MICTRGKACWGEKFNLQQRNWEIFKKRNYKPKGIVTLERPTKEVVLSFKEVLKYRLEKRQ